MKLEVGQYVVAYGYKVKNDNDIYIVKSAYESGSYCLYKVKLNGEEVKTKYRILFINPKDFTNQELTIRVLGGVADLKAAKKEVNDFIKCVEAKEVVVSYTEANKTEYKTGDIIKTTERIQTTKSMYAIPSGRIYKIEVNNNGSVFMKRLGQKGQVLSASSDIFNQFNFSAKAFNELVNENMIVFLEQSATTKGEMQHVEAEEAQEPAQTTEEQINEVVTEEVKVNTTIPVKTITFKWSEASHIIKDNTTVNTFAEANKLVYEVALDMSVNNEQGYRKTAFVIEWADGRTHEGRFDIQAKHLYNRNAIGEHVKYFYEGLAGMRKPHGWTDEEYDNHLKVIYGIDEAGKQEMKNVLETYLLIDTVKDLERDKISQDATKKEQHEQNQLINEEAAQSNVIMNINKEKNGIELKFNDKPSDEVLETLRNNGFKWSKYSKVWYVKHSADKLAFAQTFVNGYSSAPTGETEDNSTESEETHNSGNMYVYPEININDIHTYTVDEKLQKAEHDANWIFRKNEKDRTHEIQSILQHWQDQVLEVVNSTDNQRIIYYLKKALQSFKRKQYDNFVSRLRNKAAYPSMAVAGPANYNNNKANKLHNRYDKLIQESIEFNEYMKKAINRAKRDLQTIEKEKIQKQVEQTSIENVAFETVTQEADIYGHVKKFRFYKYGDYMITKAWGCYRVFKSGKEIKSDLKTTDTLETAKKYVLMLSNQLVTV